MDMQSLLEKLKIRVPLFLAPMAGVTDMPFRQICRDFGAELSYSEFVSSEGIIRNNRRTLRYLTFQENERPIGIQIFGHDPRVLADAAAFIEKTFHPDLIDLNFGCPVPKVVKKGAGSAVLKDLERLRDIASAVSSAVSLPVTAKIRSGWDDKHVVIPHIAPVLEESGIQLVTLHPRTALMRYKGRADWSLIRQLKENTRLPVIGNGDIRTASDALRMIHETGCDGVMVGRGALGNPWLLSQIKAALSGTDIPEDSSSSDKINLMSQHFRKVLKFYGPEQGYKIFKSHISWYTSGLPHGSAFRQKANKCRSVHEMETVIATYQTLLKELPEG
ncbi:MAG: tRNA-dihydrouridine synthase [Candidatus Marinimicrobia bacterium]|jgi:tRNA-dihydrouridine synthase B|nr:tRNA-dihydrouridine synthase [Candidatus Neomarinimicrobiota bacterium]